MSLEQSFQRHILKESFWTKHSKVIVAVSGGVDSMVLLHLLMKLPDTIRPKVVVAHVNHQLRAVSLQEEELVRQYCAEFSIPFFTKKWKKESQPTYGMEVAAREFRYNFLKELIQQENTAIVLLGHHLNDQAETILMRMVKGSRLEHLTGIQKERTLHFDGHKGRFIRPLLPFCKQTLYDYAERNNIPFMEDATNRELTYTRNRYRNEILPGLRQENPQVENHLWDFSEELTDLLVVAKPLIEKVANTLVQQTDRGWQWSVSLFFEESLSMQRLVLGHILDSFYLQENEKTKDKELLTYGKKQVSLIIEWLKESGPNSSLDLPFARKIVKEYDQVILIENKQQESTHIKTTCQLDLNEEVTLFGKKIGLFQTDQWRRKTRDFPLSIYLPTDTPLPLTVRKKKDGDRIRLTNGVMKKLSRVFIDQKVPQAERSRAIVIEDAEGNVIWAPPFKESSLSIKLETDTIRYILIYEEMIEK